jgi:GAF domain-containing protein
MMERLRYLFVVQHDYHDSVQATRARMLLPLISTMGLLALGLGLFMILAAATGIHLQTHLMVFGSIAAPILVLWTGTALWLIQRGHVSAAAALMGIALGAISAASLLADGIAASPLLTLPVLLTYMGLAYGTGGAVFVTILTWFALPAVAYLQSEGHLGAKTAPLSDLMVKALTGAQMITLTALLLWIFSWNLQRTLARNTRLAAQTRATAATGQAMSRILNQEELLVSAVDLIRDRFAFYHVQIFLIDETRSYANLVASTGEIGHALLAQGFRVPIGSRTVVGEVISTSEWRYVRNITETAYRHPNLLEEARSELALPLVVAGEVIGALDIHSTRPGAYSNEDVEAMRIMANQLSQSIQNARLFETQQRSLLQNRRLFLDSETNLREIERLNRQLTGQSWQEYLLERNVERFGVTVAGDEMQLSGTEWTQAMRQAAERRRMVSLEEGESRILAVPINVRGLPIGVVEVRLPRHETQSEARHILQAVTERMAFSLENARLFEQARLAVEREQQINQITARLQGLTSIEDVMTTAISALGKLLDAEEGAIRLAGVKADGLTDTQRSPSPSGNGHSQPKSNLTAEGGMPPSTEGS